MSATLFALLAVPVGAFVAVRLAAFVAAESDRRITLLAAQPVSRVRLVGGEALVTMAGALVLLTVAAVGTWIGVAAAGRGLPLGAALAGTWNTVPIVLLSLGAALFATGFLPRFVVHAGSLPAAGGFLWQVVADSTGAPGWVTTLSPFAHLAPVPLTDPDWPAAFVMVGIAAVLAVSGVARYRRRDLLG